MRQCKDIIKTLVPPLNLVQFSSVTQSCLTLCDPMDWNTPGFPVCHQLPELAQIHIHRVGDTIQPSHPLSSPSPLPSLFPSIRVFSKESVLCISWPRYWSSVLPMTIQVIHLYFSSVLPMNIQDWFPLNWLGWSPCHARVSEESSPTLQFKSINSSALSFLLIKLN